MKIVRVLIWTSCLLWIASWIMFLYFYYTREEKTPLVIESYYIKPDACTTDTNCMEQFGGDGSPAPMIRRSEYHW